MRIATIVGARPQFIKAAPLSRVVRARHREILIHTGQHYDPRMSDVFFAELGLPSPDYHLGIGSGSHGVQTGQMLAAIEPILQTEKPDAVLVYGDTNSTLAGALTAAKLHIPVAHVEAGLRSFNRRMPEEINRVLTDHLSRWCFTPTAKAVAWLADEGIVEGVHLVGDIMLEATRAALQLAEQRSTMLTDLALQPGSYAIATLHRAENTDVPERLRTLLGTLGELPWPVVLPLHPRTRKVIGDLGLQVPERVRLIEPLGYGDMLWLVRNAAKAFTDSGGLQKECYFLGVPCVTLRDETEWVETLEGGWNTVVGADREAILAAAAAPRPQAQSGQPFGAGNTAEQVVHILEASLG